MNDIIQELKKKIYKFTKWHDENPRKGLVVVTVFVLVLVAVLAGLTGFYKILDKPELITTSYYDLDDFPIDGTFVIESNIPLNRYLLKNNLRIIPEIDYDLKLNLTKTKAEIIPKDNLRKESSFTVNVYDDKRVSMFGRKPQHLINKKVNVATGFGITGITPEPDSHNVSLENSEIKIDFNYCADDLNKIKEYFKVSPNIEGKFEINCREVRFKPSASLEYATTYEFEILPGMKNKFGDEFEGVKWKIKTKDNPYATQLDVSQALYALNSNLESFDTFSFTYGETSADIDFELYKASTDDLLGYIEMSIVEEDNWEHYAPNRQININNLELTKKWTEVRSQSSGYHQTNFPLEKNGIYYLRINSGEVNLIDAFVVTNTKGLMARKGNDNSVIWATEFSESKSLSDVSLQFYDVKNGVRLIGEGTTSEDGTYENTYSEANLVVAQKDEEVMVLPLSKEFWGYYMYAFNPFGKEYQDYKAHLYTDRPIYKPGDKVNFKGIVRKDNDGHYGLERKEVKLIISENSWWNNEYENKILFSKNFYTDDFGTFGGEYVIPDDIKVDRYYFAIEVDGEKYTVNDLNVAEYRKPEYFIEVSSDKEEYISKDETKIKIKAEYFFGAPVAKKEVSYTIYTRANYEVNQRYSYYDSEEDNSRYYGYELYSGTVLLNEDGKAEVKTTLDLMDAKQDQQIYVEALLVEPGAQADIGSTTFVVQRGEIDVTTNINESYFPLETGKEVGINAVVEDLAGIKEADTKIYSKITRRVCDIVDQGADMKYYRYSCNYRDEEVKSIEGKTNESGQTDFKFIPDKKGLYSIDIYAEDGRGNKVYADGYTRLWVRGEVSDEEREAYNTSDYPLFEITSDKEEYQVGDTAKINIDSPMRSGEAILAVTRGNVISYEIINIDDYKGEYEFTVEDIHTPSIEVSVGLFQKNFREALLDIRVPVVDKKMNVEIRADKDKYEPQEEVEFVITTKDNQGNPVSSSVSLSVVDKAIFEIAHGNNIDIFKNFYHGRRSDVSTYLSMYTFQNEGMGGGGDDYVVRDTLLDTAYWNPDIRTNVNGEARVKVKLPDNLTTWVAEAKAVTKDTEVGQADAEFVVSKDVIVRTMLPRFALVDDEITLRTSIQNYLGQDDKFTVSTEADGLEIEGNTSQDIEIKNGESRIITWQAKATSVGEASVVISAQAINSGKSDAISQTFPIEQFGYEKINSWSGEGSGAYDFDLSKNSDINKSSFELELYPTVAGFIPDALKYLKEYPYSCNEQSVSRFLASIAVYQGGSSELSEIIKEEQKRLNTNQQSNGGWGWWKNDDTSPYLSAYIVYGLGKAREAGFSVSDDMYNKGLEYLKSSLERGDTGSNTKAFIHYALSELGQGDAEKMKQLLHDSGLQDYAKAYLAVALVNSDEWVQAKQLLDGLDQKKIETGNFAYWQNQAKDYQNISSDINTTAVMLRAYLKIDSNNPIIPKIANWLARSRDNNSWDSTFQTTNTVLAIVDYVEQKEPRVPNYSYEIRLNGEKITSGSVNDVSTQISPIQISTDKLKPSGNKLEIVKNGEGNLYYSYRQSEFVREKQSDEVSEGIKIQRQYLNLENQPINDFKIGDLVKVKLAVEASSDFSYVFIKDFMPAGFEAVNDGLDNVSYDEQRGGKLYEGFESYGHREIYDNRVLYFRTQMTSGVHDIMYLVRVVADGRYYASPAKVELMYAPEIYSQTPGREIKVD